MVAADFRASGKKMGKLQGIIGGDPLGELLAAGKNYAPVHQLYDELAVCGKWAAEHGAVAIFAPGTNIPEAGIKLLTLLLDRAREETAEG